MLFPPLPSSASFQPIDSPPLLSRSSYTMLDPSHPLFNLLLIVRGLITTLGMSPAQIDETLDGMAQSSRESILETIANLQSALNPSPPPSALPPVLIREGGPPASSPAPPSGKGKGVLSPPPNRKSKKARIHPPSGPGGSSTPNISTPPPIFASQSPLPIPTPLPTPTPPSGGDCSASSTSTTAVGEIGITINIERGRINADEAGDSFFRSMRHLVGVFLPEIHKTWK